MLNHYAQEPGGAGGTRHFHLAEYLRDYGWQCSIIAANIDHATGVKRFRTQGLQRVVIMKGVPFLWIDTPAYKGNGGGRIRNMLLYAWRALLPTTTLALSRPDVVIGSSVHPFAAVAGALLARRYKVPFIFEVRDLWPQTLIDMGRLRDGSFMAWALRKLELWLYRRAARTIVLLPQAWQYIVPLGIAKERVVWIPNGVDFALYPRSETVKSARNNDAFFTLMYFGAHGQANGLDNLLQAMHLVEQMPDGAHIRLRLIGDGPLKPALMAQAQKMGLKNVQFEASVPKKQIPALAAEADAFVFNLIDAPVFRFGISSNKLFDFLAGERPVIFSCDASNNPVDEAQAGLTVPPGQPQAIADAMLRLAAMPVEERQRMGRNGREYVEQNHGFSQLAGKLAAELDAVCAEKFG